MYSMFLSKRLVLGRKQLFRVDENLLLIGLDIQLHQKNVLSRIHLIVDILFCCLIVSYKAQWKCGGGGSVFMLYPDIKLSAGSVVL